MRRREFIALLSSGVAAWPLAARAQQPAKLLTIGLLGSTTPASQSESTAAFVQRLRELGWIVSKGPGSKRSSMRVHRPSRARESVNCSCCCLIM
jgi:hypothetical protein